MKDHKVIAFLPCRKGSQRVPQKNTRTFANIEGGLTKIKIKQLISCEEIDEIIVSTDDPEVQEICIQELKDSGKKFIMDDRPVEFASSDTKTDDLISYVSDLVPTDVTVLWTHTTSPFVNANLYSEAVKIFNQQVSKNLNDSLMSVTKIQKFLLTADGKSLNFNTDIEKWPQTQKLQPIYEVNSGIFIASSNVYKENRDRIGIKPYLFEISQIDAFDIDWQEDFFIAEAIWNQKFSNIEG